MRTAYFDLANGLSGDMTLACLAHVGRRLGEEVEDAIRDAVASLDLGCTVTFVDDERGGFPCLRAEVKTDGATHEAGRLRSAIASASLPPDARDSALGAFDALVSGEATVHGLDVDHVHLHELSSADTAADLVGAAAGLAALGVERISAAPVPVPTGWIESGHGPLPLPAPVTLELLRGATLRGVAASQELVTPTGAAILVGHRAEFGPVPEIELEGVGIGAGTARTRLPNICRLLVGQARGEDQANTEPCVVLETNIDDQTPESIGHAIETLMELGALDAWVTPIVMKKSRPAFQLSVLSEPSDESVLTQAIFRNTTTLGVRRRQTTRSVLDRDEMTVEVDGHLVRVKIGRLRDEVVNVAPEFEDCARVARTIGSSFEAVHSRAASKARTSLRPSPPDA